MQFEKEGSLALLLMNEVVMLGKNHWEAWPERGDALDGSELQRRLRVGLRRL